MEEKRRGHISSVGLPVQILETGVMFNLSVPRGGIPRKQVQDHGENP